MFKINAFTQKGLRYRFRVRSNSIDEVRDVVDQLFANRPLRLVLVEAVNNG